jgi:hypothetical protein
MRDYSEAVRLYTSGLSVGDCAAFYGISRQAMWMILKRRDCVFRPQLRRGKANHFHRGTRARDRAQNLCEKAIQKGVLVRPSHCEQCRSIPKPYRDGRNPIQAHHDDYMKPLAVRWLCQPCHHAWHRTHRAAGANVA